MRIAFATTALLTAALLMPEAAGAGSALRPIMHRWNHAARQIELMLSGRSAFDPAAVASATQLYAADARDVAAHVTGRSAQARDFQARFEHFAADAAAAAAASTSVADFRPQAQRLIADCRACHAIYKN